MTSHATHGEGVSAREAAAPPRGVAGRWATLTAGVLLMVGIMTMLRSGHGEWDVQHARTVFFWPGHFLTGVAEATKAKAANAQSRSASMAWSPRSGNACGSTSR